MVNPKNIAILLNANSGGMKGMDVAELGHAIQDRFNAHGHTCSILQADGETLTDSVRELIHSNDTIFVAGGDGSVTAVASHLVHSNKTLGILPFGTMNLVARDIGPAHWTDSFIDSFARGRIKRVDICEVNGHHFLHSVVLGTFANIASEREKVRTGDSVWRWPQFFSATSQHLLSEGPLEFCVGIDKSKHRVRTRSLLISNNKIVDRVRLGLSRKSLDRGRLYVYAPRDRTPFGTAGVLFRFVIGLLNADPFLKHWKGSDVRISNDAPRIKVSIDGEVRDLELPLVFRVHSKALNLWVPGKG